MLELKGITKVYRTKSGCVRALDGVSLTLPPTGLVFITGKSGCGKTTLLNLIGGLDGADEGEISLLGKSFFSFTQSDYDDYRNTFIGFIFQEYNLLNEFSVRKNIELAMEIQGGAADEGALDALMREMEIDGLQSRKPSELSGGQRQRVAIARALVKNPRIIMADEPTGALDEGTGIQVLDLLKKLSKDKLVIVVSHDREFAERYADRIIRLVDGRIAEDITFTEYTTRGNITEEGDTLLVSEGADLDEGEKNALAKAIKQRKKIEIIKKLSFREAKTTVQSEIARSAESSPELKSSRMKLKSAVSMGVKSLWVKPLRLVLTVLLSALAFAVFGLFDTLAGFTTESVVSNMMRESRTVALHGEFISDYQADDKYAVKLSSSSLNAFASESGCSVKGVYSLADNLDGGAVSPDSLIKELNSSSISVGKLYYTKTVNGYIEFSPDEISDSGVIKPFGYRLVAGAYPKPSENNEIAISTFVAQSVLHYYGEESCELLGLTSIDKLVGTTLTVNNTEYIISGLIDCGEIPQKYDTLKSQTYAVKSLSTLISDYKAFIGSGGHKCIFVPEGFLKAHKDREANATVYYGGTAKWSVQSGNLTRSATPYFYTVNDYTKNRLLLFNDAQPTVMQPRLKDDEVLVHPSNLEALFNAEIAELSPEQKDEVKLLVAQIEKAPEQNERKAAFEEFTALVSKGARVSEKAVTVIKASAVTGSTVTKTVKVVGAYIGVDKTRSIPSGYYRLMMTDALMNELGIYDEQGDYDRFLISPRDSARGSKQLLNYMLNESGLSLVWYDNSALETIRYNEELIKDTADLFLIAALVLALFSVFMLFNYIATSISNKKQSIGVLRGLGSRGKDILVTFLSESLIISLVSGLLANAIAAVGCLLVNLYIESVMSISVPFAIYGIRQFFIITGLSVITGLISSALPIARISKTKPVELIRRV